MRHEGEIILPGRSLPPGPTRLAGSMDIGLGVVCYLRQGGKYGGFVGPKRTALLRRDRSSLALDIVVVFSAARA